MTAPSPIPSLPGSADRKPRVAVLFGGRSGEHGISCVTAAGVLAAIDRTRYDVVPIGITRSGRWLVVDDDPARWRLHDGTLPEVTAAAAALPGAVLTRTDVATPGLVVAPDASVVPPDAPVAAPRPDGTAVEALGPIDVVLPLLHGPYGEDGTLQGLLELAGVRYVGAGVLASAAAMDKHTMKVLLRDAGLTVADWVLLRPAQWRADPAGVAERLGRLTPPLFVKPSRAGSSLGIARVGDPGDVDALVAALEAAAEHDPRVVVEESVSGREIECGVLGVVPDRAVGSAAPGAPGGSGTSGAPGGVAGRGAAIGSAAEASPCGEIVVTDGRDFYDFEAKYVDETAVRLDCPADLPEPVVKEIQRQALVAFDALGCEGLARVDFFVDLPADETEPAGTRSGGTGDSVRCVVNEVNTMPGFTSTSMFPRLWEHAGLSYPELVDRLLDLALTRSTGLR